MDTLVSMGVLAAYGWSLVALFYGSAGEIGMTHAFELTVQRGDGLDSIYLETATASRRSCWPGGGSSAGRSAGPARRCAR